MSKISGQAGAAPSGPKQNAMPVNHKRSVKVPPAVNNTGGAHPAARRALGAKASARAVSNTQRQVAKNKMAVGRNAMNAVQDTSLNQANAMNQDSISPSGTAADIASPSSIPDGLSQY